MSCFTKCGVSKPRVLTLVLLSVAIIVQAVSLALPEWSAIDTMYYQYPIKAYQNLWTENFIEDGGGNAFPKKHQRYIMVCTRNTPSTLIYLYASSPLWDPLNGFTKKKNFEKKPWL